MNDEKYVLNCPHCGRVEGFLPGLQSADDDAPPEAEMQIEQNVVRTRHGSATRFRCPRCGRWLQSDAARPA